MQAAVSFPLSWRGCLATPQTTRLEGKPHQCGRLLNLCRVYLLSCRTPECPDIFYFLLTRSDEHGVISIVNRSDRYSGPVGCPKDWDHLGLHCHKEQEGWYHSGQDHECEQVNGTPQGPPFWWGLKRTHLPGQSCTQCTGCVHLCWWRFPKSNRQPQKGVDQGSDIVTYIRTVKGHLGFCIGNRLGERAGIGAVRAHILCPLHIWSCCLVGLAVFAEQLSETVNAQSASGPWVLFLFLSQFFCY